MEIVDAFGFLRRLWPCEELPGSLVIWTLPDRQTRVYEDLEEACDAVKRLSSKKDVYYGVCLQEPGQAGGKKRGSTDTVVAIPGFALDIDVATGSHKTAKNKKLPQDVDEAMAWVEDLPSVPNIVVASGGGLHCYWLFEEPWILGAEQYGPPPISSKPESDDPRAHWDKVIKRDREYAVGMSKAFQLQLREMCPWHLDSTYDLTRVLRLPGTLNHKYDPPMPVSVHSEYSVPLRDPRDLVDSDKYLTGGMYEHQTQPEHQKPKPKQKKQQANLPRYIAEAVLKNLADHEATRWMLRNAESINRELWRGFATQLAGLVHDCPSHEPACREAFHDFSRFDLARYTPEETDREFQQALLSVEKHGPMTIARMREEGLPADLALPEEGASLIVHAQKALSQSVSIPFGTYEENDTGNARRFVDTYGNDVKYCHERKTWYIWNGKIWEEDREQKIYELALDVVEKMREEAQEQYETIHEIPDRDERAAAMKEVARNAKWASTSGDFKRLSSMLRLAETDMSIRITPEDLQVDSNLLPVQNGVLDLNTGELLEHSRTRLVTAVCPVEYDAQAKCDEFMRFLRKIFLDDGDLILYVLRTLGMSLTGHTYEQCVFFWYGTGANGKSTLLNVITHILGDYHVSSSPDTFVQSKGIRSNTEDLIRMSGARLVTSPEMEDGKPLDVARLKSITGGDEIVGRRLYQNTESYRPQFKLVLASNQKPIIKDDSHGTWRRIHLIPFRYRLTEEERVMGYDRILMREASGILNLLLVACLDWKEKGLQTPEVVQNAIEEYRYGQDLLSDFFEDCVVESEEDHGLPRKELYHAYLRWCEDEGIKPLGKQRFNAKVEEKGYRLRKKGGLRAWVGIDITAM